MCDGLSRKYYYCLVKLSISLYLLMNLVTNSMYSTLIQNYEIFNCDL